MLRRKMRKKVGRKCFFMFGMICIMMMISLLCENMMMRRKRRCSIVVLVELVKDIFEFRWMRMLSL